MLLLDGADSVHLNCTVPVTRDGGSWERAYYATKFDNAAALDVATNGQYTR